jgi:hypothetical protein
VEEMVREQVALRQEREGVGGDNERLFGKLERSKATEAPMADKRRDLDARLVMADAGRAVARGALEEGVARLVALEHELWEKTARLARQRQWKISYGCKRGAAELGA